MGFASAYLDKHSIKKFTIPGAPSGLLRYIIIIPAYCEPDISQTLDTIYNQKNIAFHAEVLIVFNYSESDSSEIKEQNHNQFEETRKWIYKHPKKTIRFFTLIADNLPARHAGAGLARKIAMDIAVSRFNETDNPSGYILSLDADTKLPENYLHDIDAYIQVNKKCKTLLFNFEHDIRGQNFSSAVYQAIVLYELHLRYYRRMLEYTGFPYPYFTIGSCFGIRTDLYCNVGGMSKRKAGEDFYFLQKVFPFEQVHFFKKIILNPSSRPSWRVPFGTGPEIRKLIALPVQKLDTYHPESFKPLKKLFNSVSSFYGSDHKGINAIINTQHISLREFLYQHNFFDKIIEIKNNAATPANFEKRFYAWFNALLIIKYLNYVKEKYYSPIEITAAIREIIKSDLSDTAEQLLLLTRLQDQK